MRGMIALTLGAASVAALLTALGLHVAWTTVLTTGMVLGCMAWLVVVLTLPWNLHFQAKAVLFDMQRSRERGLAVRKDREDEARAVARRMLRASIALHLGSAALVALATALSHGRWGYALSGAYLLSSIFRPGAEYYRYLRQRLGHLLAEVRFPPDDVKKLQAEVQRLAGLADKAIEAEKQIRAKLADVQKGSETRHRDLERRFTSLTRKFEETVDVLTDNQQIISGIKAFLRLVQTGDAVAEGAPAAVK